MQELCPLGQDGLGPFSGVRIQKDARSCIHECKPTKGSVATASASPDPGMFLLSHSCALAALGCIVHGPSFGTFDMNESFNLAACDGVILALQKGILFPTLLESFQCIDWIIFIGNAHKSAMSSGCQENAYL